MSPNQTEALELLYKAIEPMDDAGVELTEAHSDAVLKSIVKGWNVDRAIRHFAESASMLNADLNYFDPATKPANALLINKAMGLVS